MHNPIHPFNGLVAQLGLPCDENGIRHFLATHTPLAAGVDLPDAIFWPPSTATFLRESLLEDSDWAVVVDQLSASLRPLGK
ncbi:DUF2789 domain-containing protein [Rhodoferax sp.]|uniref:DUF2789 domain-containing protein n=1 Tax=Rhodoferax sp. TaxID=50421 RepID=UPI003BB7B87F